MLIYNCLKLLVESRSIAECKMRREKNCLINTIQRRIWNSREIYKQKTREMCGEDRDCLWNEISFEFSRFDANCETFWSDSFVVIRLIS